MFYEIIPQLGYSPYQMCLLFIFWSFFGWGMECCVHTLKMGAYSDRGFLSMPLCPIYGFGVLIINIALSGLVEHPLLMFVCSAAICTTFEFLVGVAMKKLFHAMWWDYSDEHFNFHGYICLKVTLEWGIACVLAECVARPVVEGVLFMIPRLPGTVFIIVMGVLIIIDTVMSVMTVNHINVELKELTELTGAMYDLATKIGRNLGETALETQERGNEIYAAAYLAGENVSESLETISSDIRTSTEEQLERMRRRYDAIAAFTDRRERRMLNAFPTMHSTEYSDAFETVRKKLRESIGGKRKDAE